MTIHKPTLLTMTPYVEMELDCLQNLYATLIHQKGLELRYLGAVWPWEFTLAQAAPDMTGEAEMTKALVSHKRCTTVETLKRLYEAELTYTNPQGKEAMWTQIKCLLDEDIPVISGIDQYYVPHHHSYIYRKQHGFHSLMLLGYEKGGTELICLDTMPVYTGTMPSGDYWDGVANNGSLWYSTLVFPKKSYIVEEDRVWADFHRSLTEMQQASPTTSPAVYTKYFVDALTSMLELDEAGMRGRAQALCQGMWGWEIDRKGNWLKQYLQMPYARKACKQGEQCTVLIDEINKKWVISFRSLFKGIQASSGFRDKVAMVLEKLQTIIQLEAKLADMLTG